MTESDRCDLDAARARLVSAAEASRALAIPASTIRAWATKRIIHSYGLDAGHRPLYRLDDIQAAARRHAEAAQDVVAGLDRVTSGALPQRSPYAHDPDEAL